MPLQFGGQLVLQVAGQVVGLDESEGGGRGEGGRERGREGGREGGRERGREGERKGMREGGREGGRERTICLLPPTFTQHSLPQQTRVPTFHTILDVWNNKVA